MMDKMTLMSPRGKQVPFGGLVTEILKSPTKSPSPTKFASNGAPNSRDQSRIRLEHAFISELDHTRTRRHKMREPVAQYEMM